MSNSLLTSFYHFSLPDNQIALYPPAQRDSCKLIYTDVRTKLYKDHTFKDILNYLHSGDIVVINNTRVEKSRFYLYNKKHCYFEFLIVDQSSDVYTCKVKKMRRLRIGQILYLTKEITCQILTISHSLVKIKFHVSDPQTYLEKLGELPLPPYILRQRKYSLDDEKDYQTVFATEAGSKASPTAGLHFTEEILIQLKNKNISVVPIQLFISLGTFFPIHTKYITDHTMHTEEYYISKEVAEIINTGIAKNKKIIAIGTTSLRALESAYSTEKKQIKPGQGFTNLFIKPGYQIRIVNALVTNFHTPQSTLFIMICTLMGDDFAKVIYQHAIDQNYRFYSYGDAMFIDNFH